VKEKNIDLLPDCLVLYQAHGKGFVKGVFLRASRAALEESRVDDGVKLSGLELVQKAFPPPLGRPGDKVNLRLERPGVVKPMPTLIFPPRSARLGQRRHHADVAADEVLPGVAGEVQQRLQKVEPQKQPYKDFRGWRMRQQEERGASVETPRGV